MALARWKMDRARRDAEEPERIREIILQEAAYPPVVEGTPVGSFEYRDFRSGEVKRWVIERGGRADQIRFRHPDGRRSRSGGWAWAFVQLRKWICSRSGQ